MELLGDDGQYPDQYPNHILTNVVRIEMQEFGERVK